MNTSCFDAAHTRRAGGEIDIADLVMLGLDPMGAKATHLNRSLSQCYLSFSGCYPSSSGLTGGSAEPHRAETDGPVDPPIKSGEVHDREGAFHKAGDAALAPTRLDPNIAWRKPIAYQSKIGAEQADPRVEPEDDGIGLHDQGPNFSPASIIPAREFAMIAPTREVLR
jgi:hypothetical protein